MLGGSLTEYPLITSSHNPTIKEAARLKERRAREKSGTFLIEGYRELRRACDTRHPLSVLLICPELFLGSNESDLIQNAASLGARVSACPASLFAKLSYRDRPDGLLAIAPQQHKYLPDLEARHLHCPFLVVAEAIEKPGNLGTILRSSDAAGVDALILCDRCTDLHNPNVVRASVGTLFTVPVIEAEGKAALKWLKEQGICILAATPSATEVYTKVDLTVPVAIAVGTEQLGLSDLWMQSADLQVKIPMLGVADSLNVAMATTLLLYEAVRQRSL
jgi:TrmH family RNA methyltransferase